MKKATIVISLGIVLGIGINLAFAKKPTQKPARIEQKGTQTAEAQAVEKSKGGGETKIVKEKEIKEIKDLTDEEFLKEITEMAYVGWRFFLHDEKEDFVWNSPFKKLLQIELNFTDEQLEKFKKFLFENVMEWRRLESELESKEDILKSDPEILAKKFDKGLLEKILKKRKSGQLNEEIASLKNEVSKKKRIVINELSEIRRILNGKEKQLLEWAEEIIDFYDKLMITCTPRPKSNEDLNSIKTQFFESEWYKRSLEERASESLLSMKILSLTSSQEVEIKNVIKDSIRKIDDLKAQLCAVQYGYLIEKPKRITKSTVHLIEKAEKEKSQSIVENITKLIEMRDSQIKTHLTKEQRLKFGE